MIPIIATTGRPRGSWIVVVKFKKLIIQEWETRLKVDRYDRIQRNYL